jgi:hypothetical protein
MSVIDIKVFCFLPPQVAVLCNCCKTSKTSKTNVQVLEDQKEIIQNQCSHLVQKNMQDQTNNTKLHKDKD